MISLLYGSLYSQTLEQTYNFAQKNMNEGNYELAIQSFTRVLFFNPSYNASQVNLNLAECYKKTGNLKKALKAYDIAYLLSKSDSVKNDIIFKKTGLYILYANYNFAIIELYNLPDSLSNYFARKKNFYSGIIYFQTEDFDRSYKYFSALHDSTNTLYINRLTEIFDETQKLKRYNPKVTKIMSLVIPGTGQLYVGDYKNALNSFILTAGLFTLFGYVAHEYSLLDAYFTVFPWYQRYYVGGYKSTGKITLQKRQQRKNEIYHKLISALEEYNKN